LESADRYFRPSAGGGVLAPGVLNREAVEHLCSAGYSLVLWNAICEDWARPDGSWVELALAEIERHDWTLLVLHDIRGGAMDHLPRFLDEVQARGVEIVAEMPPDLVPIDRGELVHPVDDLVA
ncbi:MAG: polysaccharide deacetylase family protein, partial [Actinomycetota bacterium]